MAAPTNPMNCLNLTYYKENVKRCNCTAHLGSSSNITDIYGEVYQHTEYLPFGEIFTEERNTAQDLNPYLYNGKELDAFTGLYYYSARYYDPFASIWLGVDPLAEKYPELSAYCYVANNPIKFKNPDGRVIIAASESLQDVENFYSSVFVNWEVMAKYVQTATDDNGDVTYSISKDNFINFVKAAGDNPDTKNAARIIGRFMRLKTYRLTINTKSNENMWRTKSNLVGTANINPSDNAKVARIGGSDQASTLNQRIAHEAFSEAFYGLKRKDLRKSPYDIHNKIYDEVFIPSINNVDEARTEGNAAAESGNVEMIQYENIFNRLLENPQ